MGEGGLCPCSFQAFFSYGGLLVMLMGLVCIMCVFSCPTYPSMCPFGFYVLAAMAPWCAIQACTMMSISHALALVEKLSLDELAPETMTASTRRWGWVAKNCPSCSRVNHIIIGFIDLAGLGVGGSVCKTAGDGDACQQPLGSPSPIRDFAILFCMWLLLALLGCRSVAKNTSLPHIFEPIPENPKKVVGQ